MWDSVLVKVESQDGGPPESISPCVSAEITGRLCFQDSEQKDYINVKGCVPQFEKWLQDNLTLVAGIFIGVALLQVSSTLGISFLKSEGNRPVSIYANVCFCFFFTDFWDLFGSEFSE